mmetsp:Transcript_42148/g.95278  ORF Transcript_42148/g.95278 Transcript_42148/m.95278 type:complete len:219 (-) Transcript_42148:225-881(-)
MSGSLALGEASLPVTLPWLATRAPPAHGLGLGEVRSPELRSPKPTLLPGLGPGATADRPLLLPPGAWSDPSIKAGGFSSRYLRMTVQVMKLENSDRESSPFPSWSKRLMNRRTSLDCIGTLQILRKKRRESSTRRTFWFLTSRTWNFSSQNCTKSLPRSHSTILGGSSARVAGTWRCSRAARLIAAEALTARALPSPHARATADRAQSAKADWGTSIW